MKYKNLFYIILKIAIAFVVAIFFINKIGLYNIINSLKSINLVYIPILIFLTTLITLFSPLSLTFLYYPIRSKNVSLKNFFKLRLLTQIFGNLTPNKVGELYLIYLLKKKYKINMTSQFYIFLIDKSITLIHTLIFTIVASIFLFDNIDTSKIIFFLTVGLISLFFIFYLLLNKLRNLAWRILGIKNLGLFIQESKEFLFTYFKNNYKYIFLNLILTFFSALIIVSLGELVFLAFGVSIPFITYFLIVNIISIIAIIPFNIFGFGIKEITAIYLFTLVGVSSEIATSAIIVIQVLRYFVHGVFYLI